MLLPRPVPCLSLCFLAALASGTFQPPRPGRGPSGVAGAGETADLETSRDDRGAEVVGEVLSPISGRLFRADFARARATPGLPATGVFRRLGFRAENVRRRAGREGEERKKHVYGGASRFAGPLGKKETMVEAKQGIGPDPEGGRFEEQFYKQVGGDIGADVHFSSRDKRTAVAEIGKHRRDSEGAGDSERIAGKKRVENESRSRRRRDLGAYDALVASQDQKSALADTKVDEDQARMEADNSCSTTEKIVAEDSVPVVKNNDTDKTLFLKDSNPSEIDLLKESALGENAAMRRMDVDDSVKLYPVYRAVKDRYFRAGRDIQSTQLSENGKLHTSDGLSSQIKEQGRSRRPLKRLALPLLLALKLKTALMLPVILGLVGLIGLKGLWAGLTGLSISAALGLKALLSGSTRVLVQPPPPPPPPPHIHHFPPHEVTEYWSRNDFGDYHPNPANTWT